MKKSVLIFLLGSTVGFGSMAGVYYKVLRKDPAWLTEQKAAFERDKELDRIADSQVCDCSKCGTADEAATVDEAANEGASIKANASIDEKIFVFKPGGLTKISFYSEAPIEDMVGINQDVRGKLVVDMNDPNRKASGGVQVQMAGFNTGLPLRDEHFRSEDWLDTNTYPDAIFEITAVETKNRIVFGQVSQGTITGTMRLKDHTYALKVPVKVRYIEATEDLRKIYVKSNLLVVEGAFELDLGPLNLSGMENAGGKKIARVLKVRIKLAGAEQAAPAPTADPIP